MAPAAVAILVISLFAEAYSAPKPCLECQTWSSHSGYQTQSGSQRSENLEDLTQQAATVLNTSPNLLALGDRRPGSWTEQNHYRTPDGHGQVFEEQGQREDGGTRIRYYKKNFTSSYSSGNTGGLAETDLGGFDSLGHQSSSHQTYGHGQSTAYDQTATRGNSHVSQGSSQTAQTLTGQNSLVHYDSYGRPLTGQRIVDQRQNPAYDQTSTRGNSYVSRGSSQTAERLTSQNSLGRYDSYGRPVSSHQTVTQGNSYLSQDARQGQGRPENWTEVNTYATDGGHGRVHEERGHYVYGPTRVQSYRKNYTSSHSSVGEIPMVNLETDAAMLLQREAERLQRQFSSIGQTRQEWETNQETQSTTGHYTQPTGGLPAYGHGLGSAIYQTQNPVTSGSNSRQTYQHTSNFDTQHVAQSGTGYGSSNGYDTQRTQEASSLGQSGIVRPIFSDSQSLQNYYDCLTQSQQAQYITTYGTQGLSQSQISLSNTNNQQEPGQTRHYEQFHTSSTSSSSQHPEVDRGVIEFGSNQGRQQTHNTHNSFDQTTNYNQGSGYVPSGQLVSHTIDLGQIAQGPDCAEGASGYTSYQQSEHPRIYRGAEADDLTQQSEDLTQQTEDLTQQTQNLDQFGQQSLWRPGKLEISSQHVQDLTQQTEDLTQQTQDLTQQTEDLTQHTQDLTQQTQNFDQFGQQSPWRSGKLEIGSQHVRDLTQQTEDLTQQTEDLTQHTQDLTQQTHNFDQFGQQSSWRPGKLEIGSQHVQDLTQQTEDLTQQTQDLTQQTEDLTQHTQDLTQQTQNFDQFGQQSSWRAGKLEIGSQHIRDLTQQTEDLTQQTQDLTQQTEDLTQHTQDLTQQTHNFDQFGQQSSWRPGKLEIGSQHVQDLTQQTEDLTQQTQDLTQQTEDLTQHTQDLTQQTQNFDQFGQQSPWRSGKLEIGSQHVRDLTQQTEDLTQQTEDLTQQTEDLTQQTQDLTQQTHNFDQFGQQSSWRPGKLEIGSQHVQDLAQQTEDLTQQTEDLTQQTQDLTQQTHNFDQFGQQSSWRPGKLEIGSQHVQDLTQQTEDLTQQTQDLTQQTEDLTQQTQDLTQQTHNFDQFGQQSSWRPGKLEIGSQHVQDLTQQTEDLTQQTQDLTQQTEDLTQQTEDLTQQTQNFKQFEQQSSWRSGKLEIGSQHVRDLTQRTEDLTQQTEDLTQLTEDLTQLTEDLTQQTEDLMQQTQTLENFGQQSSQRPGKLEIGSQRVEDLTQQTEDLTQQTEDLTQQTEDLTQQTEGHWQIGEPNYVPFEVQPPRIVQEAYVTDPTEDFTQQTQNSEDFGQQSSWKSDKLEIGSQQVEDLTQQTQNAGDFGQESSHWSSGNLELGGRQVEDLTQQTQNAGDFGQESFHWSSGNLELGGQQVEDLTQQTQNAGDFGQESSHWSSGNLEFGGQQVEDLTQQTEVLHGFLEQQTGDSENGQQSSWDLHNQNHETGFDQQSTNNPGPVVVQTPKPAPKPSRRPRPTNSHQVQQGTVEIQEPTTIIAIPSLNHAQESTQKWETTEDLHQSPPHLAVPPPPNRGDQGIDPHSEEQENSEFGVEGALVPPEPQGQRKRYQSTKTGRRGGYHGVQHRPQVIEPVAHYVQRSEQQSVQNSEKIEVPVFNPRILEAYGSNGPYDAGHNSNVFETAKPNTNTIITPPETDAWDIFAHAPTTTTTLAPTTTTTTTTPLPPPETTTEPEPTTTTPAPGFWGRVGNKFSSTLEKAKEKARSIFG